MYVLSYTGWIGVAVFYSMQAALGVLLWRTYRLTRQPLGICYWLMLVIWAHFDNYLESPFGGIPFYLVLGLCVAQAFPQTPQRPAAATRAPGICVLAVPGAPGPKVSADDARADPLGGERTP